LVWLVKIVKAALPVLRITKLYESIELALPLVHAVPPWYLGVTELPSTVTAEL